MTNFAKTIALLAALLTGSAAGCFAAESSAVHDFLDTTIGKATQ